MKRTQVVNDVITLSDFISIFIAYRRLTVPNAL